MKAVADWCGEHPKIKESLTPLGKTLTAALGNPQKAKR